MYKCYNHVVFMYVFIIIEVSYVPVYRSVDNSVPPVLGAPCSLEDCHSPPQPNINSGLSQSPVKPLLVGRAFAGPMSPAKVSVSVCIYVPKSVCVCVCMLCLYTLCIPVCSCNRQRTSKRGGGHPAKPWNRSRELTQTRAWRE